VSKGLLPPVKPWLTRVPTATSHLQVIPSILSISSLANEMMTEPKQPSGTRFLVLWLSLAAALVVLLAGVVVWQRASNWSLFAGPLHKSSLTHSLVLQQVQDVAKLVSTEATMRDVVVYEDTWLGSTKRSLVVVTGKVLAGINLDKGADVKIDEAARKLHITLPNAGIIAVEVLEMKTYDEQRGLWNAFEAADRDRIFQQARQQIEAAGKEARLAERANQSAKQMLETMFSRDGYQAEVSFYSQMP
jgi:hypothetical protein